MKKILILLIAVISLGLVGCTEENLLSIYGIGIEL